MKICKRCQKEFDPPILKPCQLYCDDCKYIKDKEYYYKSYVKTGRLRGRPSKGMLKYS